MSYHVPVMKKECMDGLAIRSGGTYIDATYGGGGHSKEILSLLEDGLLIAFDQDRDAEQQVIESNRLIFVPANFRYVGRWLNYLGIEKVDGVLADLGLSSHQLDEASRGFTFRKEEQLDMRMNQSAGQTIWQLLNQLEERELHSIFQRYGELRNAKTLARKLVERRKVKEFRAAADVNYVIEQSVRGDRNRYFAQVYQAFRIVLNDEMGALEEFLNSLSTYVITGGRMVIMSYHSLEDRRVKNVIKKGRADGKVERDEFGRMRRPWREVVKGVITPTENELLRNPRSRSAKLRIAERNKENE